MDILLTILLQNGITPSERRKNTTTYPQPETKIPAFAPGQISVGADTAT
jgi:hypothetical protein